MKKFPTRVLSCCVPFILAGAAVTLSACSGPEESTQSQRTTGADASQARDTNPAGVYEAPKTATEKTALPSLARAYDYEVPVSSTSPWPMMRRNRFNNGVSPIVPSGAGLEPWRFQTGKGIFSVPVIGDDGTVLVGSADRNFYALNPDGSVKWVFPTGEIIDSAAAVAEDGTIYFGSGDGNVYALTPEGEELWRFTAHHDVNSPEAGEGTHCGSYDPVGGPSSWFEGNVVIGPKGQLWAGNDNYRMYGLSPDGDERFAFYPGPIPIGTVWSAATTRPDGSAIFASMDFGIFSIDAAGNCDWSTYVTAPISASPAQSPDERTVYIGSWDDKLYALNSRTGDIRWSYTTREHIYSSAAVAPDGTVYIGSTDGTLYALEPDGNLKWTFDIIDPIRSSPSIAGDGTIFFGAGNGVLYALWPDGTRRWSFDTTQGDRNDLNSSPILGEDRIYLGGEDGSVFGFPYDYCEWSSDPACNTSAESDLPSDGAFLYYVTPGGRTFDDVPEPIQRGSALTFRLLVREGGHTLEAGIVPRSIKVQTSPSFDFDTAFQAGGQWVNLVPRYLLNASTTYQVSLTVDYKTDTGKTGTVSDWFTARTVAERAAPDLELTTESAPAFEIRNLAPYQPPVIVSLNQIGFDSLDFLASIVHQEGNNFVFLMMVGQPGEVQTVIDPETYSLMAMNGTMDGGSFILDGANLKLYTGGPLMDLGRFRIASQFDQDKAFDAGTSVFGESSCFDMGWVGLALWYFELCNRDQAFVAVGTIRGEAYEGKANRRPPGVEVLDVRMQGNQVVATFSARDYPADAHIVTIILVDDVTGEVIPMSYDEVISKQADASGNLASAVLTLPEDVLLPASPIRAIVVTDLFPVYDDTL